MTANVLSENERECALAGMKDFVSKPFTFERLEDIIPEMEVICQKKVLIID